MENNNLSGTDEQGLTPEQVFAEMSKAVRENDHSALDRLAKDEAPLVTEDVVKGEPETGKVEEEVKTEDESAKKAEDVTNQDETKDERDLEIARLKEELDKKSKIEHQLRSDAGRVPALQRKLKELDTKLQELAAKPPANAAETREQTRVLSEKLAQIKEADPLLAEAVEEAIKAAIEPLRQEQDSKLAKTQELFTKKEEEETLDREYAKLIQAVPNAPQVFEHPLWAEWKTQIPPNLLALAESMYADEVMVAFDIFGKYVVQKHPELAKKNEEPAKKEEHKEEANPAAEKLAAEREKKLKAPQATTKAVMEREQEVVDPQKLFEQFYAKEREKFKR